MMSKEAIKLALEALEPLVRRAAPWGELDWLNGCKAITALREALAEQPAPVQQEPVAWRRNHYPLCGKCSQATVPMKDTCGWVCDGTPNNEWYIPINPTQPAQQEPMAWLTQARCFVDVREYTESEAKRYGWIPLYTSPQPAQRKPLTDEQIDAIWDAVITPSNHIRVFVRAIEDAHGIKEHT